MLQPGQPQPGRQQRPSPHQPGMQQRPNQQPGMQQQQRPNQQPGPMTRPGLLQPQMTFNSMMGMPLQPGVLTQRPPIMMPNQRISMNQQNQGMRPPDNKAPSGNNNNQPPSNPTSQGV